MHTSYCERSFPQHQDHVDRRSVRRFTFDIHENHGDASLGQSIGSLNLICRIISQEENEKNCDEEDLEEGICADSCDDSDKKNTMNAHGLGTQHRHSSETSSILKRVSLGLVFPKFQKKYISSVIFANREPVRNKRVSSQGLFAQMHLTCAPTDPLSIIYLRQVHEEMVSSCVLFVSSSDFYFHMDVSVFQQLLCLWLRIFAWIMTINIDDDGTQKRWVIEWFYKQVESGVLNNHFILQATSSIFWDETDVPASHRHQVFDIYKCADFLVIRGKYKICFRFEFFFSIVASKTDIFVNLLVVNLVKFQKATDHFLSFLQRLLSLFDIFMSYVVTGDAKSKFVWPPWINKKVSSLLSMFAKMLSVFFHGNSFQLESLCQACTRRLSIINLIFMGFYYNGTKFLILQKACFGSVMVIGVAFQLAMKPYLARKSSMDYGSPLCVFQHFSRGCLRISVALNSFQDFVIPIKRLMEATALHQVTSVEQIMMLVEVDQIFTQFLANRRQASLCQHILLQAVRQSTAGFLVSSFVTKVTFVYHDQQFHLLHREQIRRDRETSVLKSITPSMQILFSSEFQSGVSKLGVTVGSRQRMGCNYNSTTFIALNNVDCDSRECIIGNGRLTKKKSRRSLEKDRRVSTRDTFLVWMQPSPFRFEVESFKPGGT